MTFNEIDSSAKAVTVYAWSLNFELLGYPVFILEKYNLRILPLLLTTNIL